MVLVMWDVISVGCLSAIFNDFYTDVFGISMAAVSALMLFSRFWDAINDPIVGD